jgi:hypothetical protein
MAGLLDTFSQLSTIVQTGLAVAGLAGLGIVQFGAVPKAGVGRAVGLALRSMVFFGPALKSVRIDKVLQLRTAWKDLPREQYIVVHGPKGAGKTTVVNTALAHMPGVVHVRVSAGRSENEIVEDALSAVTKTRSFFKPYGSAQRVALFYSMFSLGTSRPTVILRAGEREAGERFASIGGAARLLSSDYNLRVVIDASNNSLPEAAEQTIREIIFAVNLMPKEQLYSIEELKDMRKALGPYEELVWKVVGGILRTTINFRLYGNLRAVPVTQQHLSRNS